MQNPPSREHPPSGIVICWGGRASKRKGSGCSASARGASPPAHGERRAAGQAIAPHGLAARSGTIDDEELPESALMLEHADDLDAQWFFSVHKLLTHDCERPLVNPRHPYLGTEASKPSPGV